MSIAKSMSPFLLLFPHDFLYILLFLHDALVRVGGNGVRAVFLGANCPSSNYAGDKSSEIQFSFGAIVQGEIVRGQLSSGQLFEGQLSAGGQ